MKEAETDKRQVNRKRIGAKIASIREQQGLTQFELAEKCDFTQSTISKIEAGKFNASIDILSRLIEPMGYKVDIVKATD